MISRFINKYRGHYISLIKLGFPIVIGQLGVVVLGFADTLMVGHYGTNDLAASSFVNNVFNLSIVFCMGFSLGLTPIVGSLFGNGKKEFAGFTLRNSLLANGFVALLACIIMTVVYFNIESMGQPEELIPLIKKYYLLQLASMPFIMMFNSFKQFFDGITDTKTSMFLMLIGVTFNIIGNYLLIYGIGFLPELGLTGAGISTLIARAIMGAGLAITFLFSKKYFVYRSGFKHHGWSKLIFLRLNKIGWPIAFQMGIETASFSLSAVMIGWLGTIALAAHQVMITVSLFLFMIYMGLGNALAVRVSNFMGQKDLENVKQSAYAGFQLIMIMVLIQSTTVFLLSDHIGALFTENMDVRKMIPILIYPLMIYQFGDGLQIAFSNALRGISDVKSLMIMAFISYFVISLPLGYIFGFVLHLGILGVWMAFPFGLTIAGASYFFRFRRKTK